MRSSWGRFRSCTVGVSFLTAAAVVVAASPASADTTMKLLTSGYADASGLHLKLGSPLRQQLGGPVNNQNVALDLVNAHGEHEFGNPCSVRANKASADANLASGTGVTGDVGGQTPFASLNSSAHADASNPGPDRDTYGRVPDNPLLSGAFGPVHARVGMPAGSSASRGKLITLGVGPAGRELPAASADALIDRVQTSGERLQQHLDQALPQISDVLDGVMSRQPSSRAAAQARQLESGLRQLDAQLPALLADLSQEALLKLEGLTAAQQVTRTEHGLRAYADAKLGSLTLLAGLIELDGFHNTATAFAGGEPGTARASAEPEVFDVEIAGVLDATYGPEGLSLPGTGRLPSGAQQQLRDQLGGVLSQITDMLGQGGISLGLAAHRTDVAHDGTSAIAESGGLLVGFQPPGSDEASFELIVGRAVASVAAQDGQATCEQAPPHHKNAPPPLAYTGPRIPHSGLIGVGLLAAAAAVGSLLVVRRRRGYT